MPIRRHLTRQAALIAAAWGLATGQAGALLPLPVTPPDSPAVAERYAACARSVSHELADHLAPVFARQGAWVAQAERETRVAFGLLREYFSPGRGSVSDPYGVFTAMLQVETNPTLAAAFAEADTAATAADARYFALVYGLEYLLRAWPFGAVPAADHDLDLAFERLLTEAEADIERLRRALFDMGARRGVHFADQGLLQQVRTVVSSRHQACMLGQPDGLHWAVTGLTGGYGPGAGTNTQPNHGPLRTQVLDPDTLRILFSRTYAVDTHCHSLTAALYRDVMREILAAAERQAANALEREHAARIQRGLAEFERLRRLLDSNLKSARDIDDALAAGKRVDQAGAGLRNLEGHARSTRERMQKSLDALDAPAVAASLGSELEARARHYADERARLDAWVMRHAQAWSPPTHPAFRGDPRRGRDPDWGLPYTVQTPDRYLRGQLQAVANLAQGHLAACWEANLPAVGLVNAGALAAASPLTAHLADPPPAPTPQTVRGCDAVAQLKSPFGQWDFMRVVEHVTAERCSVVTEWLDGSHDLVDPPRPEPELARLVARAREDAAAPPAASLAGAIATMQVKVAEASELLETLDALHAEIRRKLAQPPPERLAALEFGEGRGEPADSEAGPLGMGTPAGEPGPAERCAAREAEARARDEPIGVRTYIYYDERLLRGAISGGVRPDYRANTIDSCLVVQCPVTVGDRSGLRGCLEHQRVELSPPPGVFESLWQRVRDADRRLGEWTAEKIALSPELHRLFNPQGESTLAQSLDYVNTSLCILTGIPTPPRNFKDVVETVFKEAGRQVGWMGHCNDYVSGPFAPGGR